MGLELMVSGPELDHKGSPVLGGLKGSQSEVHLPGEQGRIHNLEQTTSDKQNKGQEEVQLKQQPYKHNQGWS